MADVIVQEKDGSLSVIQKSRKPLTGYQARDYCGSWGTEEELRVKGLLHKWMEDFLSNRKMRTL